MQRATARGIRLAPATRLLYTEGTFSINGEEMPIPRSAAERRALEALADARWLSPNDSARLKLTQLYEAYQAGWIVYN